MKTIIAGSRGFNSHEMLNNALANLHWTITEVVSGTARGADRMGEEWAKNNNIPVARFPANWDEYGKSAGYRRNVDMAKYADALVVFWDGESRGAMHMYNIALREGIHIYREMF